MKRKKKDYYFFDAVVNNDNGFAIGWEGGTIDTKDKNPRQVYNQLRKLLIKEYNVTNENNLKIKTFTKL